MNTEMKSMSTLLVLLLFCSVELVFSGPEAIETDHKCCMSYETKRIPLGRIVSYYRTSSSCARVAFVFVTKLRKSICVDPSDAFVVSQASRVDRRSTTVRLTSMNNKA